jgi:ADP-heptose:LPS heptosyltransferase
MVGDQIMDHTHSILLLRLKSIGDILFTLPAVDTVRAFFPNSKITFLVSKEHATLLKGFRAVNAVLEIDRARVRGKLGLKGVFEEMLGLLRALRGGNFSLVIDFQGYGETAMMTRWTGASARWGIVHKAARKWAYTKIMWRNHEIHPADCNLALLRKGGIESNFISNDFQLPEVALQEARQFLIKSGLKPEHPLLFLQPFTSSPDKNWPLENYLAVASTWHRNGFQILFGGGPADRHMLKPAESAGFRVSAGVPLLTSAGLAHFATLTIGGDTGLLHLAVAMKKRVVMLMGGGPRPARTYPFQHPDWQVAPGRGKPLDSITIDQVKAACSQALAELGFASAGCIA